MKPCDKCKHLTAEQRWFAKKGAPASWIPFCPKCMALAEAEEDKEHNHEH